MNPDTPNLEVQGIPWQLTRCGNYWALETDDALHFIGADTPFADWIASQEAALPDEDRRRTDTKQYFIGADREEDGDDRTEEPT